MGLDSPTKLTGNTYTGSSIPLGNSILDMNGATVTSNATITAPFIDPNGSVKIITTTGTSADISFRPDTSYKINYRVNSIDDAFLIPKCGKCLITIPIVESFIETNTNTMVMIFKCHSEKRRVDISLGQFKNNEVDARDFLLKHIDPPFCEEAEWRTLKPKRIIVKTDSDIISDWLKK